MSRGHLNRTAAAVALTLASWGAAAQQPTSPAPGAATGATPPPVPVPAATTTPATTPPPSSPAYDRIAFSANGSSLTNTDGGAGASLGWLHNFDPDTLVGVAAEYEALSVSHWSFGSVNGSMTRGEGDARYTFYGEAHEGAGHDGKNFFDYRVEALGMSGTYFHRTSITLEDKQINVETTHGNLPKAAISYLVDPHLQLGLAYQYSFGGNLGTRLTSGRIDVYERAVNFLGGFAVGQASPSVLGHSFTEPPRHLTEGYVGLLKPLPQWRSDITLILDYQRLSGGNGTQTLVTLNGSSLEVLTLGPSTRVTGTLNYIYHLNGL